MRDDLIKETKKKIPSVDIILEEALKEIPKLEPFGKALKNLHDRADEIYHKYEEKALKYFAESWLENKKSKFVKVLKKDLYRSIYEEDWETVKKRFAEFFVDFAKDVQKIEKDLGNMRKARAGATFEKAVFILLKKFHIPCEIPKGNEKRELKNIDIVVPDIKTFREHPGRSVFLALKRTLRERWKEEVPAAKLAIERGGHCWLITIDEDITDEKITQILNEGIERIYSPVPIGKIYSLNNLPKDLKRIIG